MPLTTTVEGLERYGVILRYDRDYRDNLEALRAIVIPVKSAVSTGSSMGGSAGGTGSATTNLMAQVPLSQLAHLRVVAAPMGVKSEGAVPNAWINVDVKGIDVGTYVQMAMRAVNDAAARGTIRLPSGYSIFWSGQYEYMLRARQRLRGTAGVPACLRF